jgi:hypothetical protein
MKASSIMRCSDGDVEFHAIGSDGLHLIGGGGLCDQPTVVTCVRPAVTVTCSWTEFFLLFSTFFEKYLRLHP